MGSKCCCHRGTAQNSAMTLEDLTAQATELNDMTMEEATDDAAGPSEEEAQSPTLRQSDVAESSGSVSLGSQEQISGVRASNILWSTGSFSDVIPSGFYSVIPDNRLKLYKSIPTMDELRELDDKDLKADVILVDFEEDKKLDKLKDLSKVLVRGLNSNPVVVTKKIADLVAYIYKKSAKKSPAKTTQPFGILGFPLLGKIKLGSCRTRAILFKVLADSVGLESKLVVGFPSELKSSTSLDSYKHMSVVVVINTVEMLVDLKHSPGQLIPLSTETIYTAHFSAAGNDSCDSPLEPNSPPLALQSGLSGPNIATELLRRSQSRAKKLSASSSPEKPSGKARAKSRLSGDTKPIQEFSDDVSSCESDESAKLETSETPEISNDIAREVGVVSESSKQSRLMKEGSDDDSSPHSPVDRTGSPDLQKNVSGFRIDAYQGSGQESLSIVVPSSESNEVARNEELHQTIRLVLNEKRSSPMFQNKLLLPNERWNIDISELTFDGPRVGIGSVGEIFRGIFDAKEVAIKMFLVKEFTNDNIQEFCNEISILSCLRHPNVILFYGACTKPPDLSLVTEFMERGSLYHVLHSTRERYKLDWERKLNMLVNICSGLICIHRARIVHRDLRSANCLFSNNWTVKICGFGHSRMMTGGTMVRDTVFAGTPEWMAPEVLRNEPFSEKCDIFSFGVIMWELTTLSKPWVGVPKEKVVDTVANQGARLKIPRGPLDKLIADCWSEPERRPSCEQIMNRLLAAKLSIC